MHIPDGYLSPSTCGVMFVAAAPFWYAAVRRVKRLMHTRFIPLVSLFAAFSFVIMMFNLPLPGGTTGHAVGMGIAAIVLGPWASLLAISIALAIQAIFFGDGGITALGANCFNMAIVGSLVAYAVYRVIAGHTPLTSTRRVVAAGLAGYAAINASALLAAIEFGLQPLLFKDASGAPLYAPYPLSIAIPAMMIGHLTFAGLAELIVTGGIVAYLQRSHVSLLRQTAAGAHDAGAGPVPIRVARSLWAALALLLILTPLGILAVGTAWGEWAPEDFRSGSARQRMSQASGNVAPPTHMPRELGRLASVWTAPFPRYAPAIVRSATFGYMLSAMLGTGIILLLFVLIGRLLS